MRLGRKKDDPMKGYDMAAALTMAYEYVTTHGTSPHHAQVAKKIQDALNLADWVTLHDPIVYTDPAPEPEHDAPEAP